MAAKRTKEIHGERSVDARECSGESPASLDETGDRGEPMIPLPEPLDWAGGERLEEEWTTEQRFALIEGMRRCPALWDSASSDYKNRDVRQMALAEIGRTLNKSEPECLKAWNTLRSSCARELNKVGQFGGGKKKKWQFLDAMSFLHDVITLRRASSGILFSTGTFSPQAFARSSCYDDIAPFNDTNSYDDSFSDPTTSSLHSSRVGCTVTHSGAASTLGKRLKVEVGLEHSKKHRRDVHCVELYDQELLSRNSAIASSFPEGVSSTGNPPTPRSGQSEESTGYSIQRDASGKCGGAPACSESRGVVSDSCERFGRYIASCLSEMPARQRAHAQLRMQEVLYHMTVDNEQRVGDGNLD